MVGTIINITLMAVVVDGLDVCAQKNTSSLQPSPYGCVAIMEPPCVDSTVFLFSSAVSLSECCLFIIGGY